MSCLPTFFRIAFRRRVRAYAERVFKHLFSGAYDGEVFLCGGAFKPLFMEGFVISDIDLWVRNGAEREKLKTALVNRGAHLVRDFQPFCMKYMLDQQVVEVAYYDVQRGRLHDLINVFDLALCGIGARYADGSVADIFVSRECWNAIKTRRVLVHDSYLRHLKLKKGAPRLLSSLHRIAKQSAELGYPADPNHESRLWRLYWEDFTEAERYAAKAYYLQTVVQYKGQYDGVLARRANMHLQ